MAGNVWTAQVRNIVGSHDGGLPEGIYPEKSITVDVKGEILELKDTINTMVDQLQCLLAGEVTRVASRGWHRRQIGRTGAKYRVLAVPGKILTDNVNFMASNLTGPGEKYRRSSHRDRQWRSVAQDHR